MQVTKSCEHFNAEALPLMEYLSARAMKLTRNKTDADDLVQETYFHAMRKCHLFEHGTNLKAWLTRMQFNLFISHYRRRTKRPDNATIAGVEEMVVDVRTQIKGVEFHQMPPEELATNDKFLEELPRDLRDGLADLDERYRDALLMKVISEDTYQDIATKLKVPLGTVMSRISRAKAQLRKQIQKSGLQVA
ncbi:MAG: sigma-70 family RNA polymerase sigma factor [Planctomycetota bacterium]|jgi:RNA polymerase sigma-70 factor (ECF subfamily)